MLSSVLALSSLGLAAAFPQFYEQRKMGCEIPTEAFGPHGSAGEITPVDTINFSIQDSEGNVAMSWLPGEMYSVMITAFSDLPVFLWVHSSAGSFANPATTCPNAAYVGMAGAMPAAMHTFEWTAPDAATECVIVSTAQSTGPSVAYRTNTAEFCPEGVAAGAPTPAGAMTPTPADSALPGSTTPGSTTPSPTDPDAAGTPDAPAGGETSGDAAPDSAVGIAGGALAAALSLAAFVAL